MHLTVEGVDLYLPDGQPLIADVNLSILRGDTVLLGGASGSGKSTLFRAVAGIWPFGHGEIRGPSGAQVLFLPQKPYLPIDTLRQVVSYPMPAGGVDDVTVREALEAVGLRDLVVRLDEVGHWALQLSPGEQQRIAFARALVQKPDWLFLDEATSAIDSHRSTALSTGTRTARGNDGIQCGPSRDTASLSFSPASGADQWEWARLHRGSDGCA
jgi:putative ATP-binding cassette transporter